MDQLDGGDVSATAKKAMPDALGKKESFRSVLPSEVDVHVNPWTEHGFKHFIASSLAFRDCLVFTKNTFDALHPMDVMGGSLCAFGYGGIAGNFSEE